ncbi:protein of unknown function [Blastococcus saxobsidens DD2]|uniref:Uncharacterized protein n=1 Tax=Blastococcus saxobsidens (strain DD2) TaxID=1146883 RepID=H6RUA9_BLASD|nr:protein of unknown function [Blastococcus saxobsidens DD2]
MTGSWLMRIGPPRSMQRYHDSVLAEGSFILYTGGSFPGPARTLARSHDANDQ